MCLMDGVFIIFLDDILICSKLEEGNEKHLRMVLQLLRDHQLYSKFTKCSFYHKKIHYLGHIVSKEGITIDPKNINSIEGWPTPRNVLKVSSFMGLLGYYMKFIEVF
jgi:hypothetical protein